MAAPAKAPPAADSAPDAPRPSLVLPGDRASDVVAFEEQVVDFFVGAADLLGVPKSVAAIYGIVFASPAPLTFADIAARLDISKGSVSQGLRVLREIGAVKEDPDAKLRGIGYVPDLELRKLVARFLEQRLQTQLDAGNSRLALLRRTIPSGDRAGTVELERRLKSLSDWHSKARSLLPLARTVLKLGS